MKDFYYNPHDSLGFLANAASRLLNKHLTREFEAIGLNVTAEQWNVLVQLWIFDGRNQLEIAEALMLEKSSVSRLVDGLEKKHLVVRQKGADARNNYICLTEYGRMMRDQSVEIGRALLDSVQAGIDEKELAVARRVLIEICRCLCPEKKAVSRTGSSHENNVYGKSGEVCRSLVL